MSRFYKPYISDNSSSESSDSESDGYTTEESLLNLPGKEPPIESEVHDFVAFQSTIQYSQNPIVIEPKTSESKNTSLFMINSRDRDNRVYPQPTYFTMRLPHVYKNIKSINITQINLLNSFFNFSKLNGNTTMYILEEGRTRVDLATGNTIPNTIQVSIREGTYNTTDLVQELTNSLNSTPIFASIDFQSFYLGFHDTGDFSPIFNTPGPIVYNSLTQTYDSNLSIADIVARYFVKAVQFNTYTSQQALVAFYYPIVKESIIETTLPTFSVVGQSIPPGFLSWYDYIVFGFKGLNDPYILPIVSDLNNQKQFDTYRYTHSFITSLVNQYNCSYNSKQGRLVTNAPALNQSIVNDLNTQYNYYLTELALQNGYSDANDFNTKYSAMLNSNGVFLEFYNFLQGQFASNFGVNFGTYDPQFYTDSNNSLVLYNTYDKYGWNTSLSPNIVTLVGSNNTTSAPQISTLWKNIEFPQTIANSFFVSTITLDPIYIGSNQNVFFPGTGDNAFQYIDIPFSIVPTSYSRFEYRSPVRQSISFMTLPRYINDRAPNTNIFYSFGSNTPLLLDTHAPPKTYYLTDVSGNILFNMYTITQAMFFSADYMRFEDQWLNYITVQIQSGQLLQPTDVNYNQHPPINDVGITSYRPYIFFQLTGDKYLVEPNARFQVSFFIENQTNDAFGLEILVTWYKDRAAFMADVQLILDGTGVENPRHYFLQQTILSNQSSSDIVVEINNSQTTYFLVRPVDKTAVSSEPMRVFCCLTNTYGVYTVASQLDKLDLPYQNLPPFADQYTPASQVFDDNPLTSIYDSSIFQLGYDISGVSNNLLDYFIQVDKNYYDPNNIFDYQNGNYPGIDYVMNVNENGSMGPPPNISTPSTWSLYFGSNSQNVIRNLSTGTIYYNSQQTLQSLEYPFTNEFVLVNWFEPGSQNILNAEPLERFFQTSTLGTSLTFLPCVNTRQLVTDMVVENSNAYDANGLSGLGFFLPPKEIVSLNEYMIKFAYTQPSSDSNNGDFTRIRNPPLQGGTADMYYQNRTTLVNTSNSQSNDWDDWYLTNRRNTKLGIFANSQLHSQSDPNTALSNIQLSNAVCTLTLEKVTQVNNFKNASGSAATREPDWGTYYTYKFDPNVKTLWCPFIAPTQSTFWSTIVSVGDKAQSFQNDSNTYSNYFYTPAISSYTYLPRSFGIASAVGNAIQFQPTGICSGDLDNSYTAVPFYMDGSNWKVGRMHGVSFTKQPCIPKTDLIGEAPYYGPVGGYGWYADSSVSTISTLTVFPNSNASILSTFYWNAKLTFNILDIQYNPAVDLTKFGGYSNIVTEYQDTMMFIYNISQSYTDSNDTSLIVPGLVNSNWYKWGQESNTNYIAFDDQSGYNYLSYIHNLPIEANTSYSVLVRGYDPVPSFRTGLRIIGKNVTDFGQATLGQIATEIDELLNPYGATAYTPINNATANQFIQNLYENPPNTANYASTILNNDLARNQKYSHQYADKLILFDQSFSTTKLFGASVGYPGNTYVMTGYNNALTQYIDTYNSIADTLTSMTAILSTAQGQLNEYIVTRYGLVLPSTIINRNRVTDPLPFQFLFSSFTFPPYKSQYDNWGLGYNLGFNKVDTFPPVTTITSQTFIRIVQDYIYLKINPELNMNMLAVSNKEDLSQTHDPTAEDSKYFLKLILNDFASFCRTGVIQQKTFTPVLGKLDTISFQLTDKFGNQINNTDCEFDLILEVAEAIVTNPQNEDGKKILANI